MHYIADEVFDNGLDHAKQNTTKLVLLADATTNYSDATTVNGGDGSGTGTGRRLAEVTVDASDITIADGATDGRKATMAAQLGIVPNGSGDGDHVAWVDVANSKVLAVAPLAAALAGITSGGAAVDIHSHFIAMRDAQAAT